MVRYGRLPTFSNDVYLAVMPKDAMDVLEESEELKTMYYLYGIAAHNCSNIEYRIAYLLLGPKWAEIENLDPDKVTKAYEDLYSKPLGSLLKTYRAHFKFSEKTIEQMHMVLDKRNYLVHRFFGSYGRRMHQSETILEMIEDLKEMIAVFQAVSLSLDPSNWEKA